MKYVLKYTWVLISLFPVLAFAQCNNYSMKIHKDGEIIASYAVSDLDSVTFFQDHDEGNKKLSDVTVSHIYGDGSTYCAFTSLIKRNGIYYLAFREAASHVSPGDYGVIRILTSVDGESWSLKQTLQSREIDLRDPDLSEMPNGKIMITCGARMLSYNDLYVTRTYCSIEDDRGSFCDAVPVNIPKGANWETSSWIWRITWHNGVGYGVCYGDDKLAIVKTIDGLNYDIIAFPSIPGNPNECQIRFLPDDTAIMLVRRSQGNGQTGYMGKALPPNYQEWDWKELAIYLAGQNFIIDGEKLIVCTRMTQNIGDRTCMWIGDKGGSFNWCYTLPFGGRSGKGDTAYAGILNEKSNYWVSYYAIHDGEKPSIYLARIPKHFIPR